LKLIGLLFADKQAIMPIHEAIYTNKHAFDTQWHSWKVGGGGGACGKITLDSKVKEAERWVTK
jgi:hypothetical protein